LVLWVQFVPRELMLVESRSWARFQSPLNPSLIVPSSNDVDLTVLSMDDFVFDWTPRLRLHIEMLMKGGRSFGL
jgi:hypothetical protein